MSKELETLEKLLSFAFVMSENMVGLTKENYDEATFIKKTYEYLHKYNVDLKSKIELEKAIQRLEAIDNANPNEALEKLDSMYRLCTPQLYYYKLDNCYDTIKNYILKAQEQSIEEKMPIKDLVSKHIINHNSIVEVYEQEKDNSHYCKRIYRGMAWEMEKAEIGNRKLKYIFSALAEGANDFDSDRICIEVENNI